MVYGAWPFWLVVSQLRVKRGPRQYFANLIQKKGQVYSMLQAKRDVDTLLAMGIMEYISIVPQPAGESIEKNRTWTLTQLSPNQKAIGLKWIFKLKKDAHGDVDELHMYTNTKVE
ncbi:hypothetical protein L1987_35443 [Smallanthus sonchifolius]|uniref:Uncharacterized protein n=1 Tax=Smallanthus sonchifolius TaxID=185202 RepID=A0ACB9HXT2_9ASTR|nr:hypothetical protein L1987_35443 [Smallanthus sonchifolius]